MKLFFHSANAQNIHVLKRILSNNSHTKIVCTCYSFHQDKKKNEAIIKILSTKKNCLKTHKITHQENLEMFKTCSASYSLFKNDLIVDEVES